MPYRWKDFTLDMSTSSLSQHGKRIEVAPKVIDCIGHLIVHRERIVTYDELIRRLWGHDNVTNQQLAQVVLAARRVLGDDGQRQACIRTVHGRGYHWVGDPTQEISGEASASTLDPQPQPQRGQQAPPLSVALPDDVVALHGPAPLSAGDVMDPQTIETASASSGSDRPPPSGMRRFATLGSAVMLSVLLGGSAIIQAHADHAESPAIPSLTSAAAAYGASIPDPSAIAGPEFITIGPELSGRHATNDRGKLRKAEARNDTPASSPSKEKTLSQVKRIKSTE